VIDALLTPHILVSIAAGKGQLRFMRFVPGQAVAPITVGFDGIWRIGAPGVARVHVSLLFDGHQLFVATHAPELQAYVNGAAIDGRWWVLLPPAELRFGEARLRVTFDAAPVRPVAPAGQHLPPPATPVVGKTALDGAGRWEAQNRSDPPPSGDKTHPYDPSAGWPGLRGPAVPVHEAPGVAIDPFPLVSRPVAHPPLPAPEPYVPPRALPIAPPPAARRSVQAASTAVSYDEPRLPKLAEGALAAWRSMSLIKKITAFFLLPLALVALLWPEPPPAPQPAASALAFPSAAGSGVASAVPARPAGAPIASSATGANKPRIPTDAAIEGNGPR